MGKVVIVTDNSCGMTQQETDELNVKMIYIPFIIDGAEYVENKNLSTATFYEKLTSNSTISTSQPSQLIIKEVWDSLLTTYDEIVYIPLSSGLSATCKMSQLSAKEYNGKVEVVDNKRVSVTLRGCIDIALQLAKENKSAKEIKEYLETDTYNSSIYIMVPTLKYLKKGGRVTATAAAIGTLLKIKPVLQIQGDKLDAYAKVITIQQAKQKMITAVQKDMDTRFKKYYQNGQMELAVAYSGIDNSSAIAFAEEVKKIFPGLYIKYINPLPLCIACHIGPDSLAIACYKTIK